MLDHCKNRNFVRLGSLIYGYDIMREVQDSAVLEKWTRLKKLQEKISIHEEQERQKRVLDEQQIEDSLRSLWRELPHTPLRGIIDADVKRLLEVARSKRLTLGRKKKKSIAACLLLVLKEYDLQIHERRLLASFRGLKKVAEIFRNNCEVQEEI